MEFTIRRRESRYKEYKVDAADLVEACAKLEAGQATLVDGDSEPFIEANPSGWFIQDEEGTIYANYKSPCMYRLPKGATSYEEREKICTLASLYKRITERFKELTVGKAA